MTLYYSTNLLQVAVSDLWTDLIRILPEDGKSEGDQLRTDIVILHEKLLKTDAGISKLSYTASGGAADIIVQRSLRVPIILCGTKREIR